MRLFLLIGLLLAATFTAMAEDSLRWGSAAARAALNQYAGTNYRELTFDEGEAGVGARQTAPALDGVGKATPAAFLVLAPNPSTGHVRVGYSLLQTAQAVELRVDDEWGQPVGAYALTDEALTAGVTLRLRVGLYQCVLRADGAVAAKERLLITTP